MPLLLNVPYKEKDEAKVLGAKWCQELKTWYVPDRANYARFAKWLEGEVVVCNHIYIVEGTHICESCGKQTKVVGLGFDCFLNPHDVGTYVEGGDVQIDKICSSLPRTLAKQLIVRYNLKQFYSRSKRKYSYLNYCEHCGEIQSNYSLFEEVDSPFFVDGEDTAKKLVLHKIQLPYDVCIASGITYGSVDAFIKKYAQIIESDMQWSTDMLPSYLAPQVVSHQKSETPMAVSAPAPMQVVYTNWSAQQRVAVSKSMPHIQYPPRYTDPPECSWGLMLFYTVFFGWLGLHRFYAGKMGSGMLYIMTLGLFGMGWIIDIFAVLTTLFKDKQGRRIKI